MTEAAAMRPSRLRIDKTRLARLADGLAVAAVASLPWSTSATAILVGAWLVAVLPTLDVAAVRRELMSPAGTIPVAFWLLGAVGMVWASDATLAERLGGLGGFHKFLVIPLLLAQFRRSGNGRWVLAWGLASVAVLLALSWVLTLWPGAPWPRLSTDPGVPVKDYITQSGVFQIVLFALLFVAATRWNQRRGIAIASAALALLLLANILYVATGRTALVTMPVLLAAFGLVCFGWRGVVGVLVAGAILAAAVWASSPYLRTRVTKVQWEISEYLTKNADTSSGARLEFWKKSIGFVAEAPVLGNGTGSINPLFRKAATGEGISAVAARNPHQQVLAVGIQLGLVGIALQLAFWLSHLALFRGGDLVAWIGIVVVVQNVVGSMFNSHLFDFTQGWMYVLGVGVMGGLALRERDLAAGAGADGRPEPS